MRALSTVPPFEERKRGTANTFVSARSFLRFGVEELYAGWTKEKICKDMLKMCSDCDNALSYARAANGVDAGDILLPDPARAVTPSGTPRCKIVGTPRRTPPRT